MFRMILLTLAALYGLLAYYGTTEMNPAIPDERRQIAQRPAFAHGLVPVRAEVASIAHRGSPVTVVQTAPAAPRFPGPPLVPSPERAGAAQVSALAAAPAGALTVSGDSVNLRAGPGAGHQRVGSLLRGAVVTPVGPTTGAWVEVRDASGLQGFVSARFLSPNQPG